MNAIFKRSSVRTFTDDPVSAREVDDLMKAAMAAPSAGNQQPWEFYVTDDPNLKERLSEVSPYAKPAKGAAVVIIVCRRLEGLRFTGCVDQDLSACIENILLEATEMGLGSVWMGIAPEPSRMEATARLINAPDGIEPFALVAIGHPATEPTPKGGTRYNPDRVHWV